VPVTVECKLGTGRPLIANGPAHGHHVAFIEHILCINKEESPFLLYLVGLPHELHHMDSTLNACFVSNTELVHPACFFCLTYQDKANTLGIEPIPALSNSYRMDAGTLVLNNKSSGLES
jgi:hypothetical protein